MANIDPILTSEGAEGRGFWNKGSLQVDGALVLPTVDTEFTNPDLRDSGKIRYNDVDGKAEIFNGTEWTSLNQDLQEVTDTGNTTDNPIEVAKLAVSGVVPTNGLVKIGMGDTLDLHNSLGVSEEIVIAGNFNSIDSEARGILASDMSSRVRGGKFVSFVDPNGFTFTNTGGGSLGVEGAARVVGAGTVHVATGVYGRVLADVSGATIDNGVSLNAPQPFIATGSILTNAIGLNITEHDVTNVVNSFNALIGNTGGGGTVAPTGVTGNYSIYNMSNYYNYFKERLGLGTDAPTEMLDVIGNIKNNGELYTGYLDITDNTIFSKRGTNEIEFPNDDIILSANASQPNKILGDFTGGVALRGIWGGYDNTINDNLACNIFGSHHSEISGGSSHATIIGGSNNDITDGGYSAILGGTSVEVQGIFSAVISSNNSTFSNSGKGYLIALSTNGSTVDNTVGDYVFIGATENILISGTGDFRTVIGGKDHTASSSYALIGQGTTNTVSAVRGTVLNGNTNTASGVESTVLNGNNNTASGNNSLANGVGVSAPSYSEVSLGAYPTTYTPASASAINANDRAIVYGNGTGTGARSNAFVLFKNGNAIFSGTVEVATPTTGTHATTKTYVDTALALKANLSGGNTFSGTQTFAVPFVITGGSAGDLLLGTGASTNGNTFVRGRQVSGSVGDNTPVATGTTFNDGMFRLQTQVNERALKVGADDIEITDTTKGIILKSPDGTRYRITVANGGTLNVNAV